MIDKIKQFWKSETVLCAAAMAAAVSALFVPPSGEYWGYMDFRVLALLFCLMLVVAAMGQLGVFTLLAHGILGQAKTMLGLGAALVFLCFFFAMVVTNDVALITFVPFTIQVLELAKRQDKLIPIVVLQTIGANLGSMLTPIGNPQNLFLYSAFHMNMDQFLDLMTPVCTVSAGLLALFCFLTLDRKPLDSFPLGQEPGEREDPQVPAVSFQMEATDRGKLLLYGALFLLCLMTVMRILPWPALLITIILSVAIVERKLFRAVDYGLLLTFACFFIFVGNAAAIPQISGALSAVLSGREILVGAAASQVISNVPAAVLLSGFTEHGDRLLLGVNLGGLGTLIASLASLISYKLYAKYAGSVHPEAAAGKGGRYMVVFTQMNLIFLAALAVFVWLFY